MDVDICGEAVSERLPSSSAANGKAEKPLLIHPVLFSLQLKLASNALRMHELYVPYWQAKTKLQHHIIAHLCAGARPDKAIVAFHLHLGQRYEGLAQLNQKVVGEIRQLITVERELHGVYKKIVQRLTVAVKLQSLMKGEVEDVEAWFQAILREATTETKP